MEAGTQMAIVTLTTICRSFSPETVEAPLRRIAMSTTAPNRCRTSSSHLLITWGFATLSDSAIRRLAWRTFRASCHSLEFGYWFEAHQFDRSSSTCPAAKHMSIAPLSRASYKIHHSLWQPILLVPGKGPELIQSHRFGMPICKDDINRAWHLASFA